MAKQQKLFRVYYEYPTPRGYEKTSIKLFNTLVGAKKYAMQMVKETEQELNITEEGTSIVIENIKTGEIVKQWIAYEDGIEEQ